VALFEASRLFDDALENALSHGSGERRGRPARHTFEQLSLARRVIHVEPEPAFHLTNTHHQAQSLRKELQDLPIELVDRLPQLRDAWGHARNLTGAQRQQQPPRLAIQPTALIFLIF